MMIILKCINVIMISYLINTRISMGVSYIIYIIRNIPHTQHIINTKEGETENA